jgi:hypothetical protein
LLPFGNSGIDNFFVRGEADSTSGLDFLSLLVEPITDNCLGAIFVCGDSLRRKGIVGGIIELFVVSPVRATVMALEQVSK